MCVVVKFVFLADFNDGAKFESTCIFVLDELDNGTRMKGSLYCAHCGNNCIQFLLE